MRWTIYAQDLDIAGTTTISSRFSVKNLEDIRFADQYTGTVTQQLDAAITDVGAEGGGLVVSPGTMAAGSPSGLGAGSTFWLDLRGGFNIYQGSITTPVLALSATGITSSAFLSNSGNPALTGAIRLANNDAIKWRVGILDKTVLSHASGTTTLGGTAISIGGATTVSGTLACTAFSATGQISSSLATGTAPFSITSTTVVPNLNIQTISGVVVSGSPTGSGQIIQTTGVSTASWVTSAQLSGKQYIQGFGTVASGTNAYQSCFTNGTIPAAELTAGTVLVYEATLRATNNDTAVNRTPTYQFLIDGQVVATSTHAALGFGGTATPLPWQMVSRIYVGTAGAAATVYVVTEHNNAGTKTFLTVVTSLTVDTTASHTVNVQAKWDVTPDTASPLSTSCQIYKIGA